MPYPNLDKDIRDATRADWRFRFSFNGTFTVRPDVGRNRSVRNVRHQPTFESLQGSWSPASKPITVNSMI